MAERRESIRTLIPSLPSKFTPHAKPTRAVQYKVDLKSGCWICTSHAPDSGGYPELQIAGQSFRIPRFACLLFNGPGVDNSCVLHLCDNPACINPSHLRMGSYSENNRGVKRPGAGRRKAKNG